MEKNRPHPLPCLPPQALHLFQEMLDRGQEWGPDVAYTLVRAALDLAAVGVEDATEVAHSLLDRFQQRGGLGGGCRNPCGPVGGGGGRHRGRAPSCTESSSRGGIAEGRRAGAKAVVRIVVWGEDAPEVAHSPLDRFQQRGGWCVWRGVGGWGGGGKVQELLCRIVRGKGAIKVAHSLLECLQQRGGVAGGWQALRPRIPASPLSQHTRAHHHHQQHHLQMQTV